MNALINRIVQKITVDYRRLSIVSDAGGFLSQDEVRSLITSEHSIITVVGDTDALCAHYEQVYQQSTASERFLYLCDNTAHIPQAMREEAFVKDFSLCDVFPLFAAKGMLQRLSFEVADMLYARYALRKIPMPECAGIIQSLKDEYAHSLTQTAGYCVEQLQGIALDWTCRAETIGKISAAMLPAVKNGLYDKIAPALDVINNSFQQWVNSQYFGTLQSNPLISPKSVNKILPHLASKYGYDNKMALLVIDGFAYWQYLVLKQRLTQDQIAATDGCVLSWLPSVTFLSRQAIFRGAFPQKDYKQNPENEKKLWFGFWRERGFADCDIQYIADKDDFTINVGVKRLAIVTSEMDEKMHSSIYNKDLYSLTENFSGRIAVKIREILSQGFALYLATDHGSVLSHGWRTLTPAEKVFLYQDGSRGKRHLIYTDSGAQESFCNSNPSLNILQHDDFLCIRDTACFAKENSTIITHGGSHFLEMLIPFVKLTPDSK